MIFSENTRNKEKNIAINVRLVMFTAQSARRSARDDDLPFGQSNDSLHNEKETKYA